MNKYNAQIGAGGTQYAYYHEEDESSFQLVSLKQLLIDIVRSYLSFTNQISLTFYQSFEEATSGNVNDTERETFSKQLKA